MNLRVDDMVIQEMHVTGGFARTLVLLRQGGVVCAQLETTLSVGDLPNWAETEAAILSRIKTRLQIEGGDSVNVPTSVPRGLPGDF